jgi:hypothetical protein
MSSILKVDTIQDQNGNNIINENADTITIGASGDTISIPSGATLSSTDPLIFPAGTVSLPSITTTGDTNTGIFFPAADTIAFTEGGTEAMRIDSDGDVGIGTTSPQTKLQIEFSGAGTTLGSAPVLTLKNTSFTNSNRTTIVAQNSAGGNATGIDFINFNQVTDAGGADGGIGFWQNRSGTKAYSIFMASGGAVGIGTSSPSYLLTVENDKTVGRFIATTSTVGDVAVCLVANVHTNNATASDYYFVGGINGGSDKIYILGNGDLKNVNNSYGAISDIKIKQDIIDASSQWNDIKNVRVRKFRYKNDPTGFLHIGVVAQELEQVSPNLIDEHKDFEKVEVPVLDDNGNPVLNEDGTAQVKEERIPLDTTTKSVKYSILYMKAIKALQEAMERIEQLETKTTSLEARLTALES